MKALVGFQPGEGPSRGLRRDCTTGCGTDGALHSTTDEYCSTIALRWGIIDTWWWYYLLPALDRKLFIYQVNRSHQIIQQQPATVTEDWGRQFFIDYILFIRASQQEAATLYTSPLQYRRRYKIDINDVISFSIFDHEKWSQMQIILRIQNGRFMSSVT